MDARNKTHGKKAMYLVSIKRNNMSHIRKVTV